MKKFNCIKNYKSKYPLRQLIDDPTFHLSKKFLDEPVGYFKELPDSYRRVMDKFIRFSERYKAVYPSQISIGRELGLGRQRVNVIIGELVRAGLLAKQQRYNNSCIYKLSSYFTFPENRQKLRHLFKSLIAVPLALLLSFHFEATLTYSRIIRNNSFYRSTSQKRIVMDESKYIPSYIERLNIPGINLTRWGKVKLLAFNEETINHASDKFGYGKNIRDPYNYFFRICLDYAEWHNHTADFKYVAQVATLFNEDVKGVTHIPIEKPEGTSATPYVPSGFSNMGNKSSSSVTKQTKAKLQSSWKEPSYKRYLSTHSQELTEFQKTIADKYRLILGV